MFVKSSSCSSDGCVEVDTQWFKSSFSTANAGCVEIAGQPDGVALRDSKNRDLPPFLFNAEEWSAFISGVKNGEFDLV